jgi:thiol:disulfide interchange protein
MYDVDDQANVSIANQYEVSSIPTLIFIGKDGSIANKIIGEVQKEVIEQNVNNVIK